MNVFLIYRPNSTADLCDRITDQIVRRYGAGSALRNVQGRDAQDYLARLHGWMSQCQVALVIIDATWLTALDDQGHQLLANPYDPVRSEIRAALQQGKLVVPLLAHGAQMPPAEALPPDIAALAQRQAYPVRSDPLFTVDMQHVYVQMNTQLAWRPASLLTLGSSIVTVMGIVGILLTANIAPSKAVEFFLSYLVIASYIVAAATGIALSFRRRHWLWLGGLLLGSAATIAGLALPSAGAQYLIASLSLASLGVFALFGPRREALLIR